MCVAGVLYGESALILSVSGIALFAVGAAKMVLWEPPAQRNGRPNRLTGEPA